jgi:hypothetical protein
VAEGDEPYFRSIFSASKFPKVSSIGLIVKRLPATWSVFFYEKINWKKDTVQYAIVTAAHAASQMKVKGMKTSWFLLEKIIIRENMFLMLVAIVKILLF